jgi:putative ABC transport system permease protein
MLDIAFRNLWRNRRRTLATCASVAVGCVAVALFASFSASVAKGLESETVRRMGHLTIYKQGFFASGGGNTGAYGISDYQKLVDMIANDPELRGLVSVVTPTVTVGGIASSGSAESSSTFVAQGVVVPDRRKMGTWNEHGLPLAPESLTADIPADATDSGVIGTGLARILRLCATDHPCQRSQDAPTDNASKEGAYLQSLAAEERPVGDQHARGQSVNLLAVTAGGAPNVVQMRVVEQVPLGVRDLDDRFVGMPLSLAQTLLFGRGTPQATAIVVQLHSTASLPVVRARIARLISTAGQPLELLDFTVLSPSYRQVNGFYSTLSACLMSIICTVALFMTMNTISTSVYERVREIGALRALGMDRGPLRRLFVAEGVMLGLLGASAGVALGAALTYVLNQSGLSWMPPGSLRPVPMRFSFGGALSTVVVLWILMVLCAALAARMAAAKVARMRITDALRQA